MPYDYINQSVLDSVLTTARSTDSFFNPVLLGHTGFAFDGNMYSGGILQNMKATWVTEPLNSPTRGAQASFPTQGLILVSTASVSILDAKDVNLGLWMLFYFGDGLGYADNTNTTPLVPSGYKASDVSWANGLVSITMTPDPGSGNTSPLVLIFDFVQDLIYATTRA